MSEKLIQSQDDLREYFFNIRRDRIAMDKGVMVTAGIRREILTSIEQGKIMLEGRVFRIGFDNLTGGVYLAKIVELDGSQITTGSEPGI